MFFIKLRVSNSFDWLSQMKISRKNIDEYIFQDTKKKILKQT